MKTILPILFCIFLIEIVSAGISITPSTISISTFPGETHSINITVTSDGNYTLILNSTNPSIAISPSEVNITSGENNVTLNLTFSGDISSGSHTFEVRDENNVIIIEDEIPATNPTHHHSDSTVPKNNTTTNQTTNENETEEPGETIIVPTPKTNKVLIILIGIGVIGVIAFLIWFFFHLGKGGELVGVP